MYKELMCSVEGVFHLLFRGLHFGQKGCSKSSFLISLFC